MNIVIGLYLFFLGAVFGSFAGAMVWRLKTRRKLAADRSECEHCHHKLSPLDLLPLVSWLLLRGRCRYCKKTIGWTPFVLELSLGLVFAVSYLAWPHGLVDPLSVTLLTLWLVSCVMLAILFVYDLRWFLLPDKVMWPLVGVGVAYFIVNALADGLSLPQALPELAFGLLPIAGVYYVLHAVSKGEWVGFGDVKLGIFMGLVLGWQGALIALMLANCIGLAVITPGLLSGKLSRTSRIPFGPFLIVATGIALLWGEQFSTLFI